MTEVQNLEGNYYYYCISGIFLFLNVQSVFQSLLHCFLVQQVHKIGKAELPSIFGAFFGFSCELPQTGP